MGLYSILEKLCVLSSWKGKFATCAYDGGLGNVDERFYRRSSSSTEATPYHLVYGTEAV